MAEAIVFGMAENILSTMSSHAVQQIASAVGVKKDLKALEHTLSTINSVLLDADEKQLINNHELKHWVKLIKDACYEADDVLDEFATEALRRELKIKDKTFKKVWSFAYSVISIKSVSFRFKMSRKIKEIRQNFDEIALDRNNFHLSSQVVALDDLHRGREQTHSFVEESEVFGRDGVKNKIINMLSGEDDGSVVAIIGMGGLGKTTLAQLVYSDKALDQVFELKMWVGVYQDFDVKKILEKIIKSASNNECPNLEMDQLRSRFQEQVKGKKFLLVLDDVWNEESAKWDKLKFVMSSGAQGSKVVVTTRSSKVASVMDAQPYFLEGLSNDDCWSLFEKRAFARGDKQPDPKLVMIGKAIIGHCHGVPLAAKTLGSLMCLKTQEHEWEAVRDSETWRQSENEDDIMPVLMLSYNHLPFYLKQCFKYFATFRIDSIYEKNDLIDSWIAHGFIRSLGDNLSLEEVGNEYVKELLWRSLIHEPVQDSYGNLISFKVHALVYNLARDVTGTECFAFEEGMTAYSPEDIRFANLFRCPYTEVKKLVCQMPNVRELAFKSALPDEDIFSSLKCLRWISANSCPSSVGKLVHLRKLCLFDVNTVPASVTNLLNLRTFHLSGCSELRELPKDIGKMINLRHLILAESSPMSHMPLGFKYLTFLQTLTVFFVGKGVGCKLNELYGLKYLEGSLRVRNLENVGDARYCAEVNLKGKERLESLKFSWNNQDGDEDVSKANVDVLENLQPHSNLKILEIEGYMGSRFASWMMMKSNMFPKLLEVSLVKCRNIENLPPFGELLALRDLLLKDMDAVKSIEGRCGNGSNSEWFPSLKKLRLENLCNLESFGLNGDSEALLSLPSLVELSIIGCPRLKSIPLLPSVERLEVSCCGEKLVESLLVLPKKRDSTPSLVQLKSLTIKECGDLISLPENWSRLLVSLEELAIEDCGSLASLEDESNAPESTCLLTLRIEKLPKLVHLPQWIQNLTKLQNLTIIFCEGLIELPEDWFLELTSLRNLAILDCSNLESLPDGMQRLTALEDLAIIHCGSLMRWPNGLGSLGSLKILYIGCSPSLPSLPEELQQLTALRHLGIVNCGTMLGLPEWLLNFTSLEIFGIVECKNLQFLPDWFPKLTTLQILNIRDCDELTSRCQKGTGADWPNIRHIPIIRLNGEFIQKTEA